MPPADFYVGGVDRPPVIPMEPTTYMAIRTTTRLESVGECVYCGAKDGLSDEHIVPFGLGGNIVLPDASCQSCVKITSAFEGRVLGGFMHRARTTGKFPTRRPRKRPTTHNVTLLRDGAAIETQLAPDQEPGILQLPLLPPPQFFSGTTGTKGVVIRGIETLYFGVNPEEFARAHGATGLRQTDNLDVTSFARMIGKIGYCYICATLGIPPRDEVPVLPFILGSSDDGGQWIGSVNFATQSERDGANIVLAYTTYKSDVEPHIVVLVARVKLFAKAGATGYEVLIRSRPAPTATQLFNQGDGE